MIDLEDLSRSSEMAPSKNIYICTISEKFSLYNVYT